jgi:hypothetical protein
MTALRWETSVGTLRLAIIYIGCGPSTPQSAVQDLSRPAVSDTEEER